MMGGERSARSRWSRAARKLTAASARSAGRAACWKAREAFFCSRAADGCHFTLWKDCLTRGGGPMLTEKLLRLLLEKQVVRGSTGAITMLDGAISFFPNGSDRASACRPLTYEKKHR